MNDVDKLRSYPRKTITKQQLEALLSAAQDELLFPKIRVLEEKGLLVPVKASRTNGNLQYPIFLKYKIVIPEESFEKELEEIKTLHPLLQANGILQEKPSHYRKYKKAIQKLNHYLFSRKEPVEAVSRKERSFEIFSEEKQLEDKSFCGLLEKLGFTQETFCFYDTPEYCFHDFIPARKPKMTLLICENKDIWFNIRRMMFESGAGYLLDTPIDGVVYGSGNGISQKDKLTNYTKFLCGEEVSYLYWGDLDRAGLNIYKILCRNNPDLDIQLFMPIYEEMLCLAQNREIPDSGDHRGLQEDYEEIYSLVSTKWREAFMKSIEENKRIPQEIIPYTHLREIMR